MKALVRKSVVTLASEGSILLLAAVGGAATVRLLGPEAFGQMAIVVTAAWAVFTVCQASLADSIAHAYGTRRFSDAEFAGSLAALGGGLGLLSLLLGEAFLHLSPHATFAGIGPWTVRAGMLALPAMLLVSLLSSLLQMRGDVEAVAAARLADKVVGVTALLAIAAMLWRTFAGRMPPHVPVALPLGLIVAGLCANLAILSRHLRARVAGPWVVRRELLALLGRKAMAGYLGYVALFAIARLDFFLLKMLTPAAVRDVELGHYALACRLGDLVTYLGYAVSMAVSARLVGDRIDDAARLARRSILWIAGLSFAAVAVLELVAPWLVVLFGGEAFLPAVPALRFVAPGLALHYVYVQYQILMARLGWFGEANAILVIGAVSNATLNMFLIPARGIAGAALATTASYALIVALAWLLFRLRHARLRTEPAAGL